MNETDFSLKFQTLFYLLRSTATGKRSRKRPDSARRLETHSCRKSSAAHSYSAGVSYHGNTKHFVSDFSVRLNQD